MLLLGLVGHKLSGKDTVFKMLQEHCHGKSLMRLAFADELKKQVASACGVTVQHIEEHKDKFRLILQWWGTDFRRQMCGENYWIEIVLHELLKASKNPNIYMSVVTDVRFKNEANMIKAVGGKLWRVKRPCITHDSHTSETELESIECDDIINNANSLPNLLSEVSLAYMRTFTK